jgi:GNAT superfamily N-acetyltransferase
MTVARSTRRASEVSGPEPASLSDIPALNRVFSDAFTERYRKDGMSGVRVPQLNPTIWRYAMDDSGADTLVWRNDTGDIVAFNIAHLSGTEGWMGPLAVRPEWQGAGLGKGIVRAAMDWLRARPAQVIGLETMPRTMDNIGFYSALGFIPTRLTITLTVEAAGVDAPVTLLGRQSSKSTRDDMIAACRALSDAQVRGFDYSREMQLTGELGLGDTVLLERAGRIRGFAIFHSAPLVEGRAREELRVLKLVVERSEDIGEMSRLLAVTARKTGTRRVAIRVQGEYTDAYRHLIELGARVRWTDLRMIAAGYPEPVAATGVVLSNWEI